MDSKLTSNKTCDPIKPDNADDIATRCLVALLAGITLNRKSLATLGITVKNASLHSAISILRNQRYIPIESDRQADGTCDYSMLDEEIIRYKLPDQRSHQIKEMKAHVLEKRVCKIIAKFVRLLDRLNETPQLWKYFDSLPSDLQKISTQINALLSLRKGVN